MVDKNDLNEILSSYKLNRNVNLLVISSKNNKNYYFSIYMKFTKKIFESFFDFVTEKNKHFNMFFFMKMNL